MVEGKVKHVGLAGCTADQLRRAHAVHPISAVYVEWSLCARHNEVRLAVKSCEVGTSPAECGAPQKPTGFGGPTKALGSRS